MVKSHLDKPQNLWKMVIWSDETKIELHTVTTTNAMFGEK